MKIKQQLEHWEALAAKAPRGPLDIPGIKDAPAEVVDFYAVSHEAVLALGQALREAKEQLENSCRAWEKNYEYLTQMELAYDNKDKALGSFYRYSPGPESVVCRDMRNHMEMVRGYIRTARAFLEKWEGK